MLSRLRRSRRVDVAEVNVTVFMNLMVALVPFLLITAVFTQLAVKQLNLPDTRQTSDSLEPPEPGLTVVIRQSGLVLEDGRGPMKQWPRENGHYSFTALNLALAEIKQQRPAEERITLLLESGIAYDILIRAMDAAHYLPNGQPGMKTDMFPRISVGEAPSLKESSP